MVPVAGGDGDGNLDGAATVFDAAAQAAGEGAADIGRREVRVGEGDAGERLVEEQFDGKGPRWSWVLSHGVERLWRGLRRVRRIRGMGASMRPGGAEQLW